MAASVGIEPADFVLPSGPKLVVIRIDRDVLQHLDPSMEPLTDADSFSRVLRIGKAAIEHARRELSVKLFGTDIPRASARTRWPKPHSPPPAGFESPEHQFEFCRAIPTATVGIYFEQDIPAGEYSSAAVVVLTSERDPVDGCVRFHAAEVDGYQRDCHLETFTWPRPGITAQAEQTQASQSSTS